jgi:excinuclease ABC subunit C
MINSEMINIKGIGEKVVQKLIIKYKSVDDIKKLTFNELSETVGNNKAGMIYSYFHKN